MSSLPTLESPRLILRPFALTDAPLVEVLAGDFEVANTTLNIPHPYPAGGGKDWISTHAPAFAAGEHVTLAVTDRTTGTLLGAIGIVLRLEHARGELGYWIGRPYWNHGYCTEAGRSMLRYGFETLGLHRVQATHLTRNPASGRVMEKLGMRFEGIRRDWFFRNGRFEDVAEYAILSSDAKAE